MLIEDSHKSERKLEYRHEDIAKTQRKQPSYKDDQQQLYLCTTKKKVMADTKRELEESNKKYEQLYQKWCKRQSYVKDLQRKYGELKLQYNYTSKSIRKQVEVEIHQRQHSTDLIEQKHRELIEQLKTQFERRQKELMEKLLEVETKLLMACKQKDEMQRLFDPIKKQNQALLIEIKELKQKYEILLDLKTEQDMNHRQQIKQQEDFILQKIHEVKQSLLEYTNKVEADQTIYQQQLKINEQRQDIKKLKIKHEVEKEDIINDLKNMKKHYESEIDKLKRSFKEIIDQDLMNKIITKANLISRLKYQNKELSQSVKNKESIISLKEEYIEALKYRLDNQKQQKNKLQHKYNDLFKANQQLEVDKQRIEEILKLETQRIGLLRNQSAQIKTLLQLKQKQKIDISAQYINLQNSYKEAKQQSSLLKILNQKMWSEISGKTVGSADRENLRQQLQKLLSEQQQSDDILDVKNGEQ